jgi:GMP synthase (glutamine-hydrolysing)
MILIVDFGSQTTHLIGRRLRALGIAIAYTSPEDVLVKVDQLSPKGVILSGGPSSIRERGAPTIDSSLFERALPILGICYGWQLMAHLLGGCVENACREYGPEWVEFVPSAFDLPVNGCKVFMSHEDSVMRLPSGFEAIGSTRNIRHAAVVHKEQRLYGLQFHPEVDHTEYGAEILKFFARGVCLCEEGSFQIDSSKIIDEIRYRVGSDPVICGVSGGVDSTVAACLIAKAVGRQLHPVYIESGLMRGGTLERVRHLFAHLIDLPLTVIDAKKEFMDALREIEDPEQKRKIVGKLYVDLFEREARALPDHAFLAQGTIYSDVIESKGATLASTIKSHHNVGGLPTEMGLRLLEPLRSLYKDEVRALGESIGLSRDILKEHPFPGPGYAVRIRGKVDAKRLSQVQQADQIVVEEIRRAGLYDNLFQCFALMTGAFSTSVKGDAREFSEVVGVRAYESTDVMTLQWAQLPYPLLQTISSRIVNEVPHVSRVVYDITTKPPATMEWE